MIAADALIPVDAMVLTAMDLWSLAGGRRAPSEPLFSAKDQAKREKAYDRALDEVQRVARGAPGRSRRRVERKLVQAFARFAAEALSLGPHSIDLLTNGFLPAGTRLAR